MQVMISVPAPLGGAPPQQPGVGTPSSIGGGGGGSLPPSQQPSPALAPAGMVSTPLSQRVLCVIKIDTMCSRP